MGDGYFIAGPCPKCHWVSYTSEPSGRVVCNGCSKVVVETKVETFQSKAKTTELPKGLWTYLDLDPLKMREDRWEQCQHLIDAWYTKCAPNSDIELNTINLNQDVPIVNLFAKAIKSTIDMDEVLDEDLRSKYLTLGIEINSIFGVYGERLVEQFQAKDPFTSSLTDRSSTWALVIRTSDGHFFIADINHKAMASPTGTLTPMQRVALEAALMLTTISPESVEAFK